MFLYLLILIILMEYNTEEKTITIDKELNLLDKFVITFIDILEKYTDYVIVSGYVSILLGRSRATEDVDLLIPTLNMEKVKELFNELSTHFECMNAFRAEEAFSLLSEKISLRFFYPGNPLPNIEVKFAKTDIDRYSLNNKLKVIIRDEVLFISPLELQIAFKLFLGSDKDFEDAKHLHLLFEEQLDKKLLEQFINKLNVNNEFRRFIG